VRGQLPVGVKPSALLNEAEPGNPEGADGLSRGRRKLPPDPDERAIAGQPLPEILRGLSKKRGQPHREPVSVVDLRRDRIERFGGAADSEGLVVPVENGAPLGAERDGLGSLTLGQAEELFVLDDLEVREATDQEEEEAGKERGEEKCASPE